MGQVDGVAREVCDGEVTRIPGGIEVFSSQSPRLLPPECATTKLPVMPENDQLNIDILIGFGYCPPSCMQTLEDGTQRLDYKYIPWPLQFVNAHQINAALNQAAKLGTSVAELTKCDFPHNIAPEETLNEFGMILWQSLPTYAVLSLKHPWITWEAYLPPGTDETPDLAGPPRGSCFSTRSNDFNALMLEVISAFPINRWAKLHFMGLEKMLPRLQDGTPCAAGMAAPMKPDPKQLKTPDDVPEFPRAHPMERTEYPNGLFKRIWVGLSNEKVQWAKDWEAREPNCAKVIEGAVSVVPPGAEEFEWHDHHLLRLDLCARIAPNIVRMLKRFNMGHPASWGVWRIEPCYHELEPQVTFQAHPIEAGYRAAVILPMPYFTYRPESLDGILEDVKKHWR